MADEYELEDDDAPVKSKKDAGPSFDAFADEGDVNPDADAAPSAPPAGSDDGGFDAFADGGGDSDDSAADADIKPGQGKDLWLCPHCGAKNKPGRDTCRSCGKHPDEEVIIPLLSRPPVKFGLIGGIVLVLIVVVMLALVQDYSLRPAGADHITDDFIHDESSRLAGSGRILRVADKGRDIREIVVVFGYQITNENEFKDMRGPNRDNEVTRGGFSIQKHIRLNVTNRDDLPQMKKGDYLSFSGTWQDEDQTFSESLASREFNVHAGQMQFTVVSPE